MARILAIEPFWGKSHQYFLESLCEQSKHEWHVLHGADRHWKWQMRTSGLTYANKLQHLKESSFDTLFVSDYFDLASFLGLISHTSSLNFKKKILYFHENQITYPTQSNISHDRHYGMINIFSMQAADEIWFNSHYHMNSLFSALPEYLKPFPDKLPIDILELKKKSRVQYMGVHCSTVNTAADSTIDSPRINSPDPVTVIWNHRWEHDKGPELLLKIVARVHEKNLPIKFLICGQSYGKIPPQMSSLKKKYASSLVHFGTYDDAKNYRLALEKADVVLSTAHHEFFGISVLEAVMAGCTPLLPAKLSYPELIPEDMHEKFLYNSVDDALIKLESMLQLSRESKPRLLGHVQKFLWSNSIHKWDQNLVQ